MRGTSHIAIGEMARIWREITVRNVVVRELRLGGTPRPTTARRDASPHHVAATGRGHPGAAVVVTVMEAGRHAVTRSVLD